MFVALSLLEAGYTVFVNADASGTFDTRSADLANARMGDAGVYVLSQFSIVSDLQRSWTDPPIQVRASVQRLPSYNITGFVTYDPA